MTSSFSLRQPLFSDLIQDKDQMILKGASDAECYAHIRTKRLIKKMCLERCVLSRTGVGILENHLTTLEELDIESSTVADELFYALSHIKYLTLSGMELSRAVYTFVAHSPSLEALGIYGCTYDMDLFTALTKNKSIRTIYLHTPKYPDDATSSLLDSNALLRLIQDRPELKVIVKFRNLKLRVKLGINGMLCFRT